MKILSCLCSYKGCLSSKEANEIILNHNHRNHPDKEMDCFSFADGGEGTLSVLKSIYPDRKTGCYLLPGPIKCNEAQAECGIQEDTRIIETSKVLGLNLNPDLDFDSTTSFGLGILLKYGLENGFRKFLVALGGSAIADQGAGARYALGYRFYGKEGKEIFPLSGNLGRIQSVDSTKADQKFKECSFTLLADVKSPLLGENGSTYLFSEQKGAKKEKLPIYENGRRHFNSILVNCGFPDVSMLPSSGAAGGLGSFFYRFGKTKVLSGAEFLLKEANRKEKIKDYDYVLLGEGHTDRGTLEGKSIMPRLSLIRKSKAKAVLLSGIVDEDVLSELKKQGVSFFCPLHDKACKDYQKSAKEDLEKAYDKFLSLLEK